MRFHKLNATFGTLQRRTLTFAPGLNVIEAPNEAGKSTLAAFLRTMLYGIDTRDRGALADKRRYQPRSGAPMQGTLDLDTEAFGAITLQRDTVRASSPMGRFSATYTGTGEPVAALNAADCGEMLLGAPREVYERSAFIRQSALAVDGNAELERRIESLITTGEEGISYSEASAALKKQRNERRYSRGGRIPTLEREIASDAAMLAELQRLRAEQSDAADALETLRQRESVLREALHAHEIADVQEQFVTREYARRDAEEAERRTAQFADMLTEMHVPSQETLIENRHRLAAADELSNQLAETARAQQDAQTALGRFLAAPKPPRLPLAAVACFVLCISCAALSAAAILTDTVYPALRWVIVPALVFAMLFAVITARARAARQLHTKQSESLTSALRNTEAACDALKAQIERTMAQVYADIPVGDAERAKAYVRENLARRETLTQLEGDAQRKRQAYELLPRPVLKDVPARPVTRPAQPPEALHAELARVTEEAAAAKSRADFAAGRSRAIGDAGELEAALAQKREALAQAQAEYDALTRAIDALEQANAALQNRFSPELGRHAAEYFSALTGGKYDAVALDRSFHALTTEAGGGIAHDALYLSQGAGDQLYLAVRLAICDMVLPADRRAPLVLDDALVSFDDGRCHAALDLLCRVAETRQVLLLTCQHREAAYLAGRENVQILSLL